MNLEIANKAVKAAINESEKLNVKMNIAIVDAGGNLIAFSRMDNAWLGMISHKMSLITSFGHKHKIKNFIKKFDIFHDKITFGPYLESSF